MPNNVLQAFDTYHVISLTRKTKLSVYVQSFMPKRSCPPSWIRWWKGKAILEAGDHSRYHGQPSQSARHPLISIFRKKRTWGYHLKLKTQWFIIEGDKMYQTADYIETIERHHSTNDTYRSFNITIESEFQILQSVL